MMEKLDGVRGYWDGKNLYHRSGKPMITPPWFIQKLPNVALDGEIWYVVCAIRKMIVRGGPLSFYSSLRKMNGNWEGLTFQIFDAPNHKGNYRERLRYLESIRNSEWGENIKIVPFTVCKGKDHLLDSLEGLNVPFVN